jgi:hypothetical protein
MTPQLLTKSHLKRFSKAAFLVLAAALCLGLLGPSPAFAESPNGLPGSGGHTCKKLGLS